MDPLREKSVWKLGHPVARKKIVTCWDFWVAAWQMFLIFEGHIAPTFDFSRFF